jgi:hypothetical protein
MPNLAGIWSRDCSCEALSRVEEYEGTRSHEYLLSLLISYGLAMKYFLHDDRADVRRTCMRPNSRGRRSGNE